jgi:hypothetical protein
VVSAFFSCIKVDPHGHAVCEVNVQLIADIQDVLPRLELERRAFRGFYVCRCGPPRSSPLPPSPNPRGLVVVEGGWY